MKVGAPFNPYRVFQGAFAPFWLLEHRGLGAGAKLCYIRLLGFAGKDGRCYPSLETLGASLGVSERQARDYVKELERSGLIAVEQRGLRKTNVYLFVWTGQLQELVNSVLVTEERNDPNDRDGSNPQTAPADRNNRCAQDRNRPSAPDRNSCSAQDRNPGSGPSGISSPGISSQETSSSSASAEETVGRAMRTTNTSPQHASPDSLNTAHLEGTNRTAEMILAWATERRLLRLRSDRCTGLPENELMAQWASILAGFGADDEERVETVLDFARRAADQAGIWRAWSFLTLQIQLAAERMQTLRPSLPILCADAQMAVPEDPDSEWTKAKAILRERVGEIPFANWFEQSWQTERCADGIMVAVPDEATRLYLEGEYGELIASTLTSIGIASIRFVTHTSDSYTLICREHDNTKPWCTRAAHLDWGEHEGR